MLFTQRKLIAIGVSLFIQILTLTACAPPTPTVSPAWLTEITKPSSTSTPETQVIEIISTETPTPPPSPLAEMVSKVSPMCEIAFQLDAAILPPVPYGVKIYENEFMAIVEDIVFPEEGWKELIIASELMAKTPQDLKYLACVRTSPALVGEFIFIIDDEESRSNLFITNWDLRLVNFQNGEVLAADKILTDAPTPMFSYEAAYERDNQLYGGPPSVALLNEWLLALFRDGLRTVRLDENRDVYQSNDPLSDIWPDQGIFTQLGVYGLRQWEFDSGKFIKEISLEFITDDYSGIQTIPHHDSLVTYGEGKVSVWNIENEERLFTLMEGGEDISSIAVSPDGLFMATWNYQGDLWLWSLTDGKLVENWPTLMTGIFSVTFSPDGNSLAISSYDSVRLLDVTSGSIRTLDVYFSLTGEGGFQFIFSPDGNTLVIWDSDQVSIWDLVSGQKQADMDFPENGFERIKALAMSSDGVLIAAGVIGSEDILILWDTDSGSQQKVLLKQRQLNYKEENPNYLTFSSDGKNITLGTEVEGIGYLLRTWDIY